MARVVTQAQKHTAKIRKRLRELRAENGNGACWVCRTTDSMHAGRNAYGTRCKRCIELGRTNPDVEEYSRLKSILKPS